MVRLARTLGLLLVLAMLIPSSITSAFVTEDATLTVIKEVVNDNGGSATSSDWNIHVVDESDVEVTGSPQPGDENGTVYTLPAGTYSIFESDGPDGYSVSFDPGDEVTLAEGDNVTVTITNDDQSASLTVCKVVITDDGGSATADDFTFSILDSEDDVAGSDAPESDENNCVTFTLNAGDYTITEDGPSGYTPTFSGDSDDGTITLHPGDEATVTVTNDDLDPTLIICKEVINDDGGEADPTDWEFVITNDAGDEVGRQRPLSVDEPCVVFIVDEGTYVITEEGPPGYEASFSGDSSDGTVTLALGDEKTVTVTNDDLPRYSVSGYKYCCADGECTGTGLEGFTITLAGPEGPDSETRTTTTDENGYYEFTGLLAGDYELSEEVPDGWQSCTPEAVEVTLGPCATSVVSTPGVTEYWDGDSWEGSFEAWEASQWSQANDEFGCGADWVWESERVQNPIDGDVVLFQHEFEVPGTPTDGSLVITTDNGYEVYLNGGLVGSAHVYNFDGTDWQDSDLTSDWVDSSGWSSPETYNVSSFLVQGLNTLTLETANEYMGPDDGQQNGTISSNPGGLIFELTFEYSIDFCNYACTATAEDFTACLDDALVFSDFETHVSCPGVSCCQPTILVRDGDTDYTIDEFNATQPSGGDYEYTVMCGCPESPCEPATATATMTLVEPCETPSAPDFSVCLNTDLDDQMFYDEGATESCGGPDCCVATLDYSGVDTSTAGEYEYTVTCDCGESPCEPATATGTVTVVAPCVAPSAPDFSVCLDTSLSDQLFYDNGATETCDGPACCLVSLDYGSVDTSIAGEYEYTVTCDCDGSPCQPLSDTGTVTVVAPCEVEARDVTVCAPQCQAPELVNGGFETPEVDVDLGWDIWDDGTAELGWSVEWDGGSTSYSGQTRPETPHLELQEGPNNWDPYEGHQYAELDSDWDGPGNGLNGEPASIRIYQDINTCPGETYTVSYAWSPRPDHDDNHLKVYWDGIEIADHQAVGGSNTVWTVETHSGLASNGADAATRLTFVEVGDADSFGMFLDAVSIEGDFVLDADDFDFDCGGGCCDATITVGGTPLSAFDPVAGEYTYLVTCGCPDGPCDPETDSATLMIVEPCTEPMAPDFEVCLGTDLTDQVLYDSGVSESCGGPDCCNIELDYSSVDTSVAGDYEYSVTCDCEESPCEPATSTGTITVVVPCAEPSAPDFSICVGTSIDDDLFTANGAGCNDPDCCVITDIDWGDATSDQAGTFDYTVYCNCPESPCDPSEATGTVTVVAPCDAPSAPDFSICVGTSIDDDLFTANGAGCNDPDCCVITDIDWGDATSDQAGMFDYTVYCNCPESPCDPSEATGTITVRALPEANASADSEDVCESSTIQLYGAPDGMTSYSWEGPDDFSSNEQDPAIPNAATTMSGTYTLTVTDEYGCEDSDMVDVVVHELPEADASADSEDVCEGSTIQLFGAPDGMTSYSWEGPDGFSSNEQDPAIPNATTTMSGTYTLTVADEYGCEDSDTVNITVVEPCAEPSAPDFSICVGTSIDDDLFTANGAGCNDPDCCVITDIDWGDATSDQAGTFDYTVYCNCPESPCDPSEATGTVTVVAPCDAPSAPDFSICVGTSIDDDLFTANGAGCNDPDCCVITDIDWGDATSDQAGTFDYTVYCNCPESPCDPSEATGTVTVFEPCVAFAPDFAACEGTVLDWDLFESHGATCTGADCCEPQMLVALNQVDTPVEELAGALPPGVYDYYVLCDCEASPCPPAMDQGEITIMAPCEATAPDFDICIGTSLDNDLFIANGATCSGPECCEMEIDFSGVNQSLAGQYSYTVTCGCEESPCPDDVAEGTVTVRALPTAGFSANPDSGTRPLNVDFTDQSVPGDGAIVSWIWDFGDGDDSTAQNPEHTYDTNGTFTVELTVEDEYGCTDTATDTIVVTSPPSGGGRGPVEVEPICFFDVDMLGEVTRIYVTCDDGRCIRNYEPEDPEEVHFLEFLSGTQVTYERDDRYNPGPPRWIRMTESDDPPPIRGNSVGVSEVFDFIGYTATGLEIDSVLFDRTVGMQLDYDPDNLPDNTTSVGIAAWDPENREWIVMPQATGRVAGVGTATADVSHFSTFVVMATTGETVEEAPASSPAPTPGPAPASFAGSSLVVSPETETLWGPLPFIVRSGHSATVTATISNFGEKEGTYTAELQFNGENIGSQEITLGGGESKQVRFYVSNLDNGKYEVAVAGMTGTLTSHSEINWVLLGGLIASVLGATAVLIARERKRRKVA